VAGRLAFAVFVVLLGGCGGPASYSSREFSGTVKDATTGAPVSGAVVVATWKVSRGRFPHGFDSRILHVSEAVTDENGRYTLNAWGPKPRPVGWKLDVYDTGSLVFKPGYAPRQTTGHNIGDTGEIPPPLFPETALGPIKQDLAAQALLLGMRGRDVCCEASQLEHFANYILLLSEERRRLAGLGVPETQLRDAVDVGTLSAEQRRILEQRRKLPR
jgi:hypothetical protein